MKIDDNFYMKLAINEAWKYQLLTFPNPAVGCVIVKNGEILAIQAHKEAGQAHAEVNALKAAFLKKYPDDEIKTKNKSHDIHEYLIKNHNNFFENCIIYLTLEPCNHIGKTPSCAKLLKILKPKKVVIAHEDINKKASGGYETLKNANIELSLATCMKKEAYNLLFPFIKWTNGTFIFYKMAQTLNGCINGNISSNIAKAYIHTLRDKIDLLLIGGNTVRKDRPTLDARYVAGHAPDVMIYSKNKIFDENIALFKVANRKVIISDDLFKLLNYKFVMVEGTYNLMNILKQKIDYFILLISPKIKKGINTLNDLDIDFEIIHENYIGEDKIIYLKRK